MMHLGNAALAILLWPLVDHQFLKYSDEPSGTNNNAMFTVLATDPVVFHYLLEA